MNTSDRLLALTQKTLDELDNSSSKLSNAIRASIRLARLRSDYENLWWLEYEMISFQDESARNRFHAELASHYTVTDFKKTHEDIVKAYTSERRISTMNDDGSTKDKGNVCILSVADIEDKVRDLDKEIERSVPPAGMHTLDLFYAQDRYNRKRLHFDFIIGEYQGILNRVRHRVHNYLSNVEKQLVYGQINSDIFERNRQYVDQQLSAIAPEALSQFIAAFKRLDEMEPEAGSQALLSCRRILKSVADQVYPARLEPVVGTDGKSRKLTDDMYKARLWQFVSEKVKGSTAGQLILVQIEDIGNRIDRVYELASKGVHSNVTEAEVSQCVIQTYLLIGDILRLNDETSAIYESGEK